MTLTKTDFLCGHQCAKALYLRKHGERLGIAPDALSASAQLLVYQGHDVGKLAQQRFPGGVNLLETVGFDMARRIEETRWQLAEDADVLYEAVLEYAGSVCAVDVLVRDGSEWRVHEVKSGTSVEDHHVLDAAFQHWVLTRAGLNIRDIYVTHVNNQYVRQGCLDPDRLFVDESVLSQVRDLQDAVGSEIAALQGVLAAGAMPDVAIGPQCSDPRDCPYRGHCWQHVPDYSVFNLTRGGKKCWSLYGSGVVQIKDIPNDFGLSAAQRVQVDAEKTGTPVVDRTMVMRFLDSLKYPIAHIDFETVANPIPEYDGMRPYQQMPFQWSVHRQETAGGEIVHHEFLADASGDPREPFVASLLNVLEGAGSVLVYNKTFEAGRLAELRDRFPEYAGQLQSVIDRLVDLMVPFQRQWYYSPQMHGSYSIKAVLPALVPELTYGDLAIGDGTAASAAFVSLKGETDPGRIVEIRRQLLAYCCMDTWAMVRVLARLYEA
jgi:hypothetical protein